MARALVRGEGDDVLKIKTGDTSRVWAAGGVAGLHAVAFMALLLPMVGTTYGLKPRSDTLSYITEISDVQRPSERGEWYPTPQPPPRPISPVGEEPAFSNDPSETIEEPTSTVSVPGPADRVNPDPLAGAAFVEAAPAQTGVLGGILDEDLFAQLVKALRAQASDISDSRLMAVNALVEVDHGGAVQTVRLSPGSGSVAVDSLIANAIEGAEGLIQRRPGTDRVMPGWYALPSIDLSIASPPRPREQDMEADA